MSPSKSEVSNELGLKGRRRRRHPRFRVDFTVEVTHLQDSHYERIEGHGKDLSAEGIGLFIGTDLMVGEVSDLKFRLPGIDQVWNIRAVVRHRAGYRYGFEFLMISDEEQQLLIDYLHALQPLE